MQTSGEVSLSHSAVGQDTPLENLEPVQEEGMETESAYRKPGAGNLHTIQGRKIDCLLLPRKVAPLPQHPVINPTEYGLV